MTIEEQRIAIAEICGWRRQRERIYEEDEFGNYKHRRDYDGNYLYWWQYTKPDGTRFNSEHDAYPDYHSRHDEMAEAEKLLKGSFEIPPTEEVSIYYHTLINLAYPKLAIFATPAEKAEAFLKAKGKWKSQQ
jgi:hypothetical protein